MLRYALKEWAVICAALAAGRQALVLRKGGVAERGGVFEVEHRRFWLFTTFLHQHRDCIKPAALPLLEAAEAGQPPAGVVRLSHFAEVADVYEVSDLAPVLQIAPLHLWSEETVRSRFAYRRPGLFVLALRVWRTAKPAELPDSADYAGCKSWVELERELQTACAEPVLSDAAFHEVLRTLDIVLRPAALA